MKIMRTLLTGTFTWGCLNVSLKIAPQPLNIRQKVLGEDHENAAESYFNLGVTQYMLRDYTSFTELHKRALNIRQKVLGEDHEKTADNLGITQIKLAHRTSGSDSHKRVEEIRQKASGDDRETYLTAIIT